MTRTALLPTPGDPFMLAYWLRNFETWRDEVDELVVFVNGASSADMALDQRMVAEVGGRFLSWPGSVGHAPALRCLLEATSADHVLLCEDDAYVRKPGSVDAAFRQVEDGYTDIVGSPRHEDYAGQWVEFGPFTPDDPAELRRGLWPTFLFMRRADLLATDGQFGDWAGAVGAPIPGLGRTVTEADVAFINVAPDYIHLDTLFPTTFQLRSKGLRTQLVHHVRLYDAPAVEDWLAEDPPWFHITNLSTLHQVASQMPLSQLPDLDEQGGHWTRRMAWWRHQLPTVRDRLPAEMVERREAVLADFVAHSGMRETDLAAWERRFAAWERVPA